METDPKKTVTYKTVTRQIEAWVKDHSTAVKDYTNWYVGVTNNPEARKAVHKSKNETHPDFWIDFNARSHKIALTIETHFHKKGMLETDKKGGIRPDSKFVYVYKKYITLFD